MTSATRSRSAARVLLVLACAQLLPRAARASQYPLDQATQIFDVPTARKLRLANVWNTSDFLGRGRTDADRRALALQSGLPLDRIKGFVVLADLMRVAGIGPDVARLLVAAGVRSMADLRAADPGQLAARVRDLNHRNHLLTNPPGEPSLRHWVELARRLPDLVAPDEPPGHATTTPPPRKQAASERQRWLLDVMR